MEVYALEALRIVGSTLKRLASIESDMQAISLLKMLEDEIHASMKKDETIRDLKLRVAELEAEKLAAACDAERRAEVEVRMQRSADGTWFTLDGNPAKYCMNCWVNSGELHLLSNLPGPNAYCPNCKVYVKK